MTSVAGEGQLPARMLTSRGGSRRQLGVFCKDLFEARKYTRTLCTVAQFIFHVCKYIEMPDSETWDETNEANGKQSPSFCEQVAPRASQAETDWKAAATWGRVPPRKRRSRRCPWRPNHRLWAPRDPDPRDHGGRRRSPILRPRGLPGKEIRRFSAYPLAAQRLPAPRLGEGTARSVPGSGPSWPREGSSRKRERNVAS